MSDPSSLAVPALTSYSGSSSADLEVFLSTASATTGSGVVATLGEAGSVGCCEAGGLASSSFWGSARGVSSTTFITAITFAFFSACTGGTTVVRGDTHPAPRCGQGCPEPAWLGVLHYPGPLSPPASVSLCGQEGMARGTPAKLLGWGDSGSRWDVLATCLASPGEGWVSPGPPAMESSKGTTPGALHIISPPPHPA